MTVERITRDAIDAAAIAGRVAGTDAGAVLTFAGTVRETHLGRRVSAVEYHAYEPMATREIERIEAEIRGRWNGVRVAIVHRIGRLALGDTSVLIAVASPHRAEGFDALRHAIEALKKSVPIWKREVYADGSEAWLEGS